MKKLIALLLALLLPAAALADMPDITGLSYDELVQLKDQINIAMWNSQEWQEVNVPEGVWLVGEDIPAGHWTIRAAHEMGYLYVSVFDKLDEFGKGPAHGAFYWDQDIRGEKIDNKFLMCPTETDVELTDGLYINVSGDTIFTPYSGKPDLGFK